MPFDDADPGPGAQGAGTGAATSHTFGIHHADRPRRGSDAVRRLLPRPADRCLDRLSCGLVTCYTRASGLRGLVVCPPLAFLAGSVLAQLITAADAFAAATGILITLGTSAPWLFTGTGLTMAIALGRGWRPELATSMLANLRTALRDIRPRGDRWVDRR